MAAIRLKVELNDSKPSYDPYRQTPVLPLKFVYILHSPSDTTIDKLKHLLEEYIIRQYSKQDVQIVRLTTNDGYYLSDDELCSNVFQDNEQIVCFGMKSFVQENCSTLDFKNLWCEIEQHDTSDDYEKYVQVGLNNSRKLFIRIHGTSNIDALYLFNVFQLSKIANEKSKNNIIARLGQRDWFIEAKWEYDSSKKILFLICSVKLGSSEQIWSKRIQLLLDEAQMCIEKGEISYLSGESADANKLTEKQLQRLQKLASNIPPPKRSGPEIDIDKDANKTITKHECKGESLVRMVYGGTNNVKTYQDSFSSGNGTFCQHFLITHINFLKKSPDNPQKNTSSSPDKPISVVNIVVLYQTEDGSWRECEDIAIAPIALRGEEPRWLADSVINIEPDKLVSYVIKCSVSVKGEPGRDNAQRRRVHKTFPQPLKLQIVIKDNFNKRCSLIVEQLNEPLDVTTSSSFTQSSTNELLAFVYADNCECDERSYLAVYLNKNNHIVFSSSNGGSITYERRHLRTIEFNAKQNKTTEVPIDLASYQYGTETKKAIGIFDPETFMLYAIRLEVTTATSYSEETVILPVEKIQ